MPGKSVFWKLHFKELYHLVYSEDAFQGALSFGLRAIRGDVSSDGDRDGNLTFLERRQRV